ncbi:predicted protein [Plenodomus lingam JN3]|uniref:Predicted protein n=1 Tax=Leptosphaeria maculans (strain JN3 / isolate v23.1.3 / race Av1-4-5-6-7-8) TaxID=985895 RepID=E5A4Q7_LEPMJ|nr:predicted protein [Plenodomus lingam JN3]CBX98605.1 predicted protein [Plenodomus lingam JN3]
MGTSTHTHNPPSRPHKRINARTTEGKRTRPLKQYVAL